MTGWSGWRSRWARCWRTQVLAMPDLPQELVAVPVPLYMARSAGARGFNQVGAAGARFVEGACGSGGRRCGSDIAAALLVRQRDTESQAGLNPHQRRRECSRRIFCSEAGDGAGRHVLLVDDIFTTGATARACSTALMRRWGGVGSGGDGGARAEGTQHCAASLKICTWKFGRPGSCEAELPMEQDFVFWEESGRPVATDGQAR